jgi:TPR repeat protein
MFQKGLVVAQDHTEAARWYRMAADAGFGPAQLCYGLLCAKGHGVPMSSAEAAKWLGRASAQGLASATFHLGVLCGR